MNRRQVLRVVGVGLLAKAAEGSSLAAGYTDPRLPFYLPQEFGAAGDGVRLDSPAINAAIDRAAGQGGGVVYLRPGIYLSGTVVLRSRVTLYLEAGAVLRGSTDIRHYTPQPGPGVDDDANQRHLLFARDAEDITIAGGGAIDGQGKSFWIPTNRQQLPPEEHWQDVVTRDWTFRPRVSPMVEIVGCERVHIEGVRIENSSGWTMRLINCTNVAISGISIKNPVYGINVDGIDITNSSDVRISDCLIDTADDAICLKSENPYGATVPACRNIVVTNCTLSGCCNGFKIGTRTEGAFENITFSNSVIFNEDVDLNQRIISGICLEMADGGSVEGVVIQGIRMQRTRTPIFLRLGDRSRRPGKGIGTMRGIMISDILASDAVMTSSITGIPARAIEDITLSNIQITTLEETKSEWAAKEVPEAAHAYPEARMFGRLPAYGLYVRHAHGIRLRDIRFAAATAQQTPAVVCDDVKDLQIAALEAAALSSTAPLVALADVQGAWIRDTQVKTPAPALLSVTGAASSDILVSHCDLRKAEQPAMFSPSFPAASLQMEKNVDRH